jgi:mannosyltransferase
MPVSIERSRAEASASERAVASRPALRDVEAIATNFKRRLSGVTSTLERVVPVQARSVRIAALGPGLSAALPKIGFLDLLGGWRRPATKPFRIWHARRNVEMLPGWLLRDLLRMRLRIVFTSAAQRQHRSWTRFLIGRMDAVIATSGRSASYLRRTSTIVRHGIDVATFRPSNDRALDKRRLSALPEALHDKRLVGCFGRVRPNKGTDVFVDSMIELLPTRPDVAAIILGRTTEQHGGFRRELQRRIEAAGLVDRIHFLGEVPFPMEPWYRILDLYIAPPRWEGFGVTPLEAMASGVPVVATTVGAFEELVVEGRTGSLIPPGEVAPMVEAAARWLDDPAASSAAAVAAREHVSREFSIESEAAGINAVYERVWREGR